MKTNIVVNLSIKRKADEVHRQTDKSKNGQSARKGHTYFNLLSYKNLMTICPECNKEFTTPKISFETGLKPGGEKFEYAICSCPNCDKCFGVITLPL